MGKRKISEQQEREAADAYRQGDSTTTLATRYKVSRTAIKFLLRRLGVPIRPPGRPSTPAEELEPRVVQLRLEGVRLRDIARRVGATDSTVSEILIRRGLHTRLKRGENSTARRRVKPEQEAALVKAYHQGDTQEQLARRFECTTGAIRAALRRTGTPMRARGAVSTYRTDPSFADDVMTRWGQGYTITQIASELGVGTNPVSRVLQDRGHTPKDNRGEKHPLWKGGRRSTPEGYVQVLLQPDHPMASMRTVGGYVLEHRLVMAEYLGRALLPTESVHHIDGNRQNNTIENLQLRIGQHGSHVCYRCADCGSARLQAVPIAGA